MARAKTATRGKKRVKKNIAKGVAHVHSTFNNTIVTVTDEHGTHIAGIIGGHSTVANIFSGVCRDVNLVSLKMNENSAPSLQSILNQCFVFILFI